MTRADAVTFATTLAQRLKQPAEVWEHVGGKNAQGVIMGQGRFVVRLPKEPAPKWVWAHRLTVSPRGKVTEVAR